MRTRILAALAVALLAAPSWAQINGGAIQYTPSPNALTGPVTITTGPLTLSSGQVLGPAADNCTAPPFSFTGQTTSGLCSPASGTMAIRVGGVNQFALTATSGTYTVPLLLPDGSAAAPSLAASAYPTNGVFFLANAIGFSTAGVRRGYTTSNGWYLERDLLALGASSNVNFYVAAADTLALRRGVNAQTFIVNGTWTDAANYVRASFAATATTVTVAAQTAGTGADNIDIALTPAGTGNVTTAGGITSSNAGALGWSVVAAANQECTTTCTSAAVLGFDTASGTVPVGPTDAAADICLCAGAN